MLYIKYNLSTFSNQFRSLCWTENSILLLLMSCMFFTCNYYTYYYRLCFNGNVVFIFYIETPPVPEQTCQDLFKFYFYSFIVYSAIAMHF